MTRYSGHDSFFSYNVQRPYPFRWFTPVAIVGGIILVVLISFANFVAYGYQLSSVYASHPNMVGHDLWFKHWPMWLTKNINASCQPASIPVNSQVFTNKSALSHTLWNIYDNETGRPYPSLTYFDTAIEDCDIDIVMRFDCNRLVTGSYDPVGGCRIEVRADALCAIDGPNGRRMTWLTSLYEPYPGYHSAGSDGLVTTTHSSSFWAQQLLIASWLTTNDVVFNTIGLPDSSYNSDKGIKQGRATFYRNEAQTNIEELDFFYVDFTFNCLTEWRLISNSSSVRTLIEEDDVAGTGAPPIWLQADRLAKSMYSAVLTDLGQTKAPRSSNIVANPDILQYFTLNLSSIFPNNTYGMFSWLDAELVNGTYDDYRDSLRLGPLEITPSVILIYYLCNIPRMKSAGNIFISVLLADLVFLNAAWALYRLIVERLFLHSFTAHRCLGCINDPEEAQPLRDLRQSSPVPSLPPIDPMTEQSPTAYEPLQMR